MEPAEDQILKLPHQLVSVESIGLALAFAMLSVFVVGQHSEHEAERRSAALSGLAGSVRSSAALAHSIWVAEGSGAEHVVFDDGRKVEIDLQTGFPEASTAGIRKSLPNLAGFDGIDRGTRYVFTIADIPPAQCNVTYVTGPADGAPPRVTVKNNSNGGDCG
jgi:MSHA pilin protein MshA